MGHVSIGGVEGLAV